MNELLSYISSEAARHGKEIAQLQSALCKQRNLNFLAGIVIFSLALKISSANRRIKALEAASEGESE